MTDHEGLRPTQLVRRGRANEKGVAALDPQWAGGRPRLINDDDIGFIVTTALI